MEFRPGYVVGLLLRAGEWSAVTFMKGFADEIVGIPLHESELGAHAFLRFQEIGADVGEGAGAFAGDFIGGEHIEEIAEDVVDINLREVMAERRLKLFGKFAGEVLLVRGGLRGVGSGIIGEGDGKDGEVH